MDSYTIALIIHLFCAIIFIGFIFADVFVFPALNKVFGDEQAQKIKDTIYARGVKIYPLSVLLLIASGGMMFSRYINSDLGYMNTNMQILLLIKVALVLVIALGIIYALFSRITKTQPASFMKYFHKTSFFLTLVIVLLAKLMFVM